MKINIIVILFTLIANIGLLQAQYTAIPDPCFEHLLISENIDSEGTYDGQVLTADIENITILELDAAECQGSNLIGIQDFTALEQLYFIAHNIEEIDLSQNLNLTILECHGNNLTSLDISANLQLTRLVCAINNINNFIVGENINLEYIEISDNQLSIIDVSNLINLTGFGCGHNNIISLDLSQNTNIEKIGIGNNNSLEYLDLRNGNNSNMTYYNSTDTPNLTCIYVDNAQYSTTNWSQVDEISTFIETEAECEALVVDNTIIENQIFIYSNPIKNTLNIEITNTAIKEIIIYSILGEEVIKTVNEKIDLSSFDNGIYIVKIKTTENNIITKKIIKIGA